VFGLAATLGGFAARGAALGEAGPRESLLGSESLDRWTVGLDYERQARRVTLDGGADATLYLRSTSAFLGYDFAPWFTLFGTVGQAEGRLYTGSYGDTDLRLSAGVDVNLWQYDVADPGFLAGRLTLRGLAEFASSNFEEGDAEVDFTETFGALTLNYEIFVEDLKATRRIPYSLVLYVGPAYSALDGEAELGGAEESFDEDRTLGFAAGADLFVAHNLSLGFHLQEFDHTTYRGTLRYHF